MTATIDDALRQVVKDGVAEYLAPFVRRLSAPEPLTYSVHEAAVVLGVSDHMVRRAIADGHLRVVPHMGERRLIPRRAVEALIDNEAVS